MPTELSICRKCKGAGRLTADVEKRLAERGALGDVVVTQVRCQDICKGAVAGVEVAGTQVWFRRLRGGKDARSLAKLAVRAESGPVPKRLVPHRAVRRDGRPVRR